MAIGTAFLDIFPRAIPSEHCAAWIAAAMVKE